MDRSSGRGYREKDARCCRFALGKPRTPADIARLMAGDARIGEWVEIGAWNALAVQIGILNAPVAVI